MTEVPALNGRGAAQQFLEEHDMLTRELMLAKDEGRQTKELLHESMVKNDLLMAENDRLRARIDQERSRGDRYQRYTVAMSSYLTAVDTAIQKAREMGLEAAQEVSEKAVDQMTPEEKTQLASLATRLAPNVLS